MSLVRIATTAPTAPSARRVAPLLGSLAVTALLITGVSGCGSTTPTPVPPIDVGSIQLNTNAVQLEKGYHQTLTATVRNKLGTTVTIPVVWRSLNESIATVDANGRVFAVDTGVTGVYATSLGVNSAASNIRVVFQGPSKIATSAFTAPSAISAGGTPDSLRVLVTDRLGNPVTSPTRVAFAVTAGGGTVAPAIAVTKANGIASAEWKLGPAFGLNTVTATVLCEDDKPCSFATPNVTTFSITSFPAISAVAGDAQTGVILSALPVNPSVLVLDSLSKPRVGVPVTFTPTGGGRVAATVVSTGADGTASPGVWTLGDVTGEQTLIAKVGLATTTLKATGTGTALHYMPSAVVAGAFVTCGLATDGTISCFGEQPKVGDSTLVNRFKPTPTKTTAKFTSLAAGMSSPSHLCAVALDASMYCWGQNSLTDTVVSANGFPAIISTQSPRKVQSTVGFTQAAPGGAFNCAIASDENIYCWGDNSAGQLGDKTTTNHYAPTAVNGGFKFAGVSSGAIHACGVTTNGIGLCWGGNGNGQLGNGTTTNATTPTAVSGLLNFKSIGAGDSFSCGLTTTGKAYCWGNLGTGSLIVSTPRTYATAPDFTSLSVGGFHVCGLTADGSAYCWGNNTQGQLGDSTVVERPAPTAVLTTMKFKSISAGYGHTCGATLDGSVACWGLNRAGELGDSTTVNRTQPRFIVTGVQP
ncbi:MAG: Ig-like domain-containing protein [Gemmatimonadaceae bacterium]